mmetsp:Transcript_23899/g.65115  ORF Transcript_23899/g.65115 Transcript_23899/m.65115 type:complete len:371 (-) Transcript_23899:15-1127(-)
MGLWPSSDVADEAGEEAGRDCPPDSREPALGAVPVATGRSDAACSSESEGARGDAGCSPPPDVVFASDAATCRAAVDSLLEEESVAIDIEGVELGRHPGKVCIIQAVGLKSPLVYLFDVAALGADAFDAGGLQQLFGSSGVLKVFWDVRSDTDALLHNHGCEVKGAYDLQVLFQLKFWPQVPFLSGLKKAIGEFAKTKIPASELARVERIKEAGIRLFAPELGGSYSVWEERPLKPELVTYCAADVKYLLQMKALWSSQKLDDLVAEITAWRIRDFTGSAPVSQESKKQVDFKHLIPADLKPDLPPGMVEEVVSIPAGRVGRVVGRGGSRVKQIEASSGASLSVSEGNARVTGTRSQVDSAVRKVREAMR